MNNKDIQEKYIKNAIKELKLALSSLNKIDNDNNDFKNVKLFIYYSNEAKKNVEELNKNIYRG